ncbi:Integrator complex subunit 2 [Hypsibius exemplaris]|uniref:Integrator complex subunit 2 n=1 Tax=Hypsibius exemplaris TaxID=2072580 RepID=A0A9X6RKN0_HYPEX|nr:Integrator complex subunit 2 [Hypsibius exemplaris]
MPPVDIFHDPFLRQKPPGLDGEGSFKPGSSVSVRELRLLRAQLQDFDLSEIQQDALCDFNVRKKLGQDASQALDPPGGRSSLLPDTDNLRNTAALFNNASLDKKIRLILSDLIRVQHLSTIAPPFAKASKWEWRSYPSEIFSSSTCVNFVAEIVAFLAEGLEDILPFNTICHTVLRMPHGLWLLGKLLLAHPERVSDVCAYLMRHCSGDDIDDAASLFYGKVLLYISHILPLSALHIRHLAISQQKFFVLTLSVALQWQKRQSTRTDLDREIVDLLTQLVASPMEDFRKWSNDNVRRAGNSGLAPFEECRLQLLIRAYKLLPATTLELCDSEIVSVMQVMRLYIHLKESAELVLTTEEYRVLSKLAICRPTCLSALSNQFIVLQLCCFTLLPDLLVDRTVEVEFVEWIKQILQVDVKKLDEMVPDGGTHLEVLLLITSHLRASHYKLIAEMLSDCLSFKVAVKSNSTVRMKNLLNNEVFRDDALLRHTLRIPPTQNLNAALVSALPVNCIYSLLQNKTTFASCDSLIKDWILAQMRKCTVPVHPVMVQVLALYIERTLPFAKKIPDGTDEYVSLQKPFRPSEICSILYDIPEPTKLEMRRLRTVDLFSQRATSGAATREGTVHVSKILMAFYVLAYNNHYMNHLKAYMVAPFLQLQPYGMDLLNKIPFKFYLAVTIRNQELYDPLGDVLGRLMLEVLPQMRTVYDDMQSRFYEEDELGGSEAHTTTLPTLVAPSASQPISRYLDLLSRCPVDRLCASMDDFIDLLPRLCSETLPAATEDAFEKVWSRLVAVDSNTMFFASTCAFLLLKDKTGMTVTTEDLCFEPLHILRSDQTLFQRGFLTRIILRIFTAHLTASKLYFSNQLEIVQQELLLKRSGDSLDPTRDAQKATMFILQESLAVQILIENCTMPWRSKADFGLPSELTESQSAICTFIHRLILANPTLAKLVIFQGFPLAAVPCIVKGVESLHICFDYLHEAMDLPSVPKKLFILELCSCLCIRFRIPRTLVVARLAVDVIGTMVIAYPQAVRHEIISVGARCLARIGNVFPPLRDDCLAILEQMRAMDRSGSKANRQWRHSARNLIGGVASVGRSSSTGVEALIECAAKCVTGQPVLTIQND